MNQLYLPADQRPGAVAHLRPFVARDRPALVVVDVATAAGLDVALRHQLPVVVNNPTMLFLGVTYTHAHRANRAQPPVLLSCMHRVCPLAPHTQALLL